MTALTATGGTGVPGQLVYGDWCVAANGVVPGSSTQTLYVDDCSDDPKQIWTVNADPATISNADGNCLTLGRAANGVPVRLALCCVVFRVGWDADACWLWTVVVYRSRLRSATTCFSTSSSGTPSTFLKESSRARPRRVSEGQYPGETFS